MSYDSNYSGQRRGFGALRIVPIIIAVLVVAFQFFSSEKFTNEAGRSARVALSPEQETQLGMQSYEHVLSESQRITSGPEYDMVRRVAQNITRAVDERSADTPKAQKFEWAVSLVKDQQANAFCLPGGKIVVFSGILPVCQNDAGLAAVVGHEVAHATARHGSERMLKQQAAQTILSGVQYSIADMDYQQQRTLMGVLGAGARYGVLMPWGRDQESEADHIGLLYMARAGYNPQEAVSFWERMEKQGGNQAPEFMSTHPSHGHRVQQLKELMPKAMEEYQKAKGKNGGQGGFLN